MRADHDRGEKAVNRLAHPVAPLYDANSRVLILGTFPSPKSREAGFYYMHPQNRFWRVLAVIFDEPMPEGAADRAAFALRHNIALWDVVQSCEITGASDAAIRDPVANDLSIILQHAPIEKIFTTGKKSLELYQRLIYKTTKIVAAGLPSTSPANCGCSFEALCAAYKGITVSAELIPEKKD